MRLTTAIQFNSYNDVLNFAGRLRDELEEHELARLLLGEFDFGETEDGDLIFPLDEFKPGIYFIFLVSEWDRAGDMEVAIVHRIPDIPLSQGEYMDKLVALHKERIPLAIMIDQSMDAMRKDLPEPNDRGEVLKAIDRHKAIMVEMDDLGLDIIRM